VGRCDMYVLQGLLIGKRSPHEWVEVPDGHGRYVRPWQWMSGDVNRRVRCHSGYLTMDKKILLWCARSKDRAPRGYQCQ